MRKPPTSTKKSGRAAAPAPKPPKGRPSSNLRSPIGLLNPLKQRWAFGPFGYHSVQMARQDNRFSVSGSGEEHEKSYRDQLRNQTREFGRDNGLFQGVIGRATGYIVGTGFGLQVKTEDLEWNALAEAWFKNVFWQEPDISGIRSGIQVEELITKELLRMGDVGALWTRLGKIDVVESEQIRGRSYGSTGLQLDANKAVTGYWVCPYSNGQVDSSRSRLVPRENFMFLAQSDRPSSLRGVPPLQAAFSMFHRINAVCDAEALAWQMLSRLALIINKKDGAGEGLRTSDVDETKEGSDQPHVTDRVQDWDEGITFWGETDEEVRGVDRNIPGANFPASLTMFLRLLGLPLGLPLEMVLLDWSKSNYSQSRAVLQQAFQMFIGWQQLLEKRFYRPLWTKAVDWGIKSGQLPAPKNDETRHIHEWIKPTFPWIDQLKETQAWGEMVDRGFATYAQVCKSRDKDVEEVRAALKDETLKAIEISEDIYAKTGVRVPWQYFAGKSVSVNAEADPEAETSAEDEGGAAESTEDGEKTEKKPAPKRTKKAARGTVIQPIVNLTVKPTPAPIRRNTRIKSRGADGKAEDIEQTFEYPPGTEVA